jgi:hypothetical protein
MIVLLAILAGPAVPTAASTRTEVVAAGPEYAAGPVWRFFFGRDYRDLWTKPIAVPVLDLDRFAGGLTPTKTGGRRQTHVLWFKGSDGREYKFRSVDKDSAGAIPKEMRGKALETVTRDQTSSGYPAAPLMVEPLLQAAGLLQSRVRLVVLPDSPRLGEHRSEFAGMLGTIEEPPDDDHPADTRGFERLERLVDTYELYEILQGSASERLDDRAYLRARLMDAFLGDWDRHEKQWDWGKSTVDGKWKPIPKDRDQAFSRYDGVLVGRMSPAGQTLGKFRERYEHPIGFTWGARDMDRRLLSGLGEEAWREEAQDLTRRLTDDVIATAVHRMPAEYQPGHAERVAGILRARRDRLVALAQEWYEALAHEVDVYATDDPERLYVSRTSDGLDLRIITKKDGHRATFDRHFTNAQTHEIRVYLEGGDDETVVQGTGPITLRVVGGPGADVLDDTEGGHTRYYDFEGENGIREGPGTKVETKPWPEPEPGSKEPRERDWGSKLGMPLWLSAGSDTGIFVGGGVRWEDYGFRRRPYASRHTLRAGYALGAGRARAEYLGDFRQIESNGGVEILARASGIEVLRFYGFGNETANTPNEDFFRANASQILLSPSLYRALGAHGRFRIGPRLRYSWGDLREDRFVRQLQPYGTGRFGEAGLGASLDWDTRKEPHAPRRGLAASIGGTLVPPVWDVTRTFGEVHGGVTAVVPLPNVVQTALVTRVGGKSVFGDYPYQDAAFLGGSRGDPQVRGLRGQRYAGDTSVFWNNDLRLRLFRTALIVPTEVGVYGLYDMGRVFLASETSHRWHHGVGGGIWIAPVDRHNTLTFSAAQSEGRTAFYFNAGFLF